MALWPARREQNEDRVRLEIPDVPQPAGDEAAPAGDAPGQLEQLCARLDQLGELLGQTNRQLLTYLVDRESKTTALTASARSAAASAEKIDSLAAQLDQLDAKLKSPGGTAHPVAGDAAPPAVRGTVQDPSAAALSQFCDGVNRQFAVLADCVQKLQERMDAGLQGLADRLGPKEPQQPAPGPAVAPAVVPACGDDWQRALLGADLAEYPGVDFQPRQLLAGVLEGDAGACSLLGQLLVFRSARTDKMPPLLKDIGEAYYRWQPKNRPGSEPMEEALAAWLKETLQEAGIANTVELVEPGERFDSSRHTASTRGVEITEVRGWVVLRDNGKVYTKASVGVR